MSPEHQRALRELREFRDQVKAFQERLSQFPSIAPPEAPPGVLASPIRDNRPAVEDALNTLLSTIGIQEIYLLNVRP